MDTEKSRALEPKMLGLGEVRLVDNGTGPALLLLHGNGRTWEDWRPQLRTLSDQFRCIAYDQRGFGQSTLNWDLLSLVQLADDAADVLNRLGINHAYVVGISMGAQVAQILARRYQNRVDGIVLGGSPYLAEDFEMPEGEESIADLESMTDDQLLDYANESLSRLKQGGEQQKDQALEAERDALIEQFKAMRDDPIVKRLTQRRFCPEDLAILQEYEKVDVPTLVLHGEADVLPVEGAARMSERIPGAQLVVIPDGQHISNLEPTSELFDEAVTAFVNAELNCLS